MKIIKHYVIVDIIYIWAYEDVTGDLVYYSLPRSSNEHVNHILRDYYENSKKPSKVI